jgi:hypothetical protein
VIPAVVVSVEFKVVVELLVVVEFVLVVEAVVVVLVEVVVVGEAMFRLTHRLISLSTHPLLDEAGP